MVQGCLSKITGSSVTYLLYDYIYNVYSMHKMKLLTKKMFAYTILINRIWIPFSELAIMISLQTT